VASARFSTPEREDEYIELKANIEKGRFNNLKVFTYNEVACPAYIKSLGSSDIHFEPAPIAYLVFDTVLKRVAFFSLSKTLQMAPQRDGKGEKEQWVWDMEGRYYQSGWQGSRTTPHGSMRDEDPGRLHEEPKWFKFSFGGDASTRMGYPLRTIVLNRYHGHRHSWKAYVQALGSAYAYPHAHMTAMCRDRDLSGWSNLLCDFMMAPAITDSAWYHYHHAEQVRNVLPPPQPL
jgi:hypothetical protein